MGTQAGKKMEGGKEMSYMGLEKGQLNLISFTKNQIDDILAAFKIDVEKEELYVKGKLVTCPVCGSAITKSNLGNILPGSRMLLCDDPACFAHYVSENAFAAEE